MKQIKQQLFAYCQEQVNSRIARIKAEILHAREAANEDSKSSAGDKYETGTAMMHLEQEKNQGVLNEALILQKTLGNINPQKTYQSVQLGSLVITSMGAFYISVSLGKTILDGQSYFLVSAASPIGKALLGQVAGASVAFNGKTVEVEAVY